MVKDRFKRAPIYVALADVGLIIDNIWVFVLCLIMAFIVYIDEYVNRGLK